MDYPTFHRLLLVWLLAAARLGGAMAICPALTDSMIPGIARRLVVLAFSAVVVPHVLRQCPAETQTLTFLLTALREALLGALIGFFAAIPFWVAQMVGSYLDNQRGSTMGEVFSPLSGTQDSTLAILFSQVVTTLFFCCGALMVFLAAVYGSYRIWPVFGAWGGLSPALPAEILGQGDSMLALTTVIAAPIIIVMFLATIGLGFVNRTAPQLNVFFLSMPVKSALGIFMLILYLRYIMDMLIYTSEDAILTPLRRLLLSSGG